MVDFRVKGTMQVAWIWASARKQEVSRLANSEPIPAANWLERIGSLGGKKHKLFHHTTRNFDLERAGNFLGICRVFAGSFLRIKLC